MAPYSSTADPRVGAQVAAEEPPPPGQLVEDCDALSQALPFAEPRAGFLAAQLRTMRAHALRLDGEHLPLPQYARQCLGVDADWQPESLFEAAHAQLDAALPNGSGSLGARLQAWQHAHALPPAQASRLPELVNRAVAETRARTSEIVPLPPELVVDVELSPGPHRGHYAGGHRSTIYINDSQPFNLADLFYVVAHEGSPGHIAESLLTQTHLVEEQDQFEHRIRFMISPSFVVSEGLGLHAQEIVFPGDEAQAWLTDAVLAPLGIAPDGSDFAAIHDARNVLWGVWGNAALLADRGRPDPEIAEYLSRWALLSDAEQAWALTFLRTPAMDTYVLGYYHGWRLLRSWLDHPERLHRVRRLLTEPILPADLAGG